MKGTEDMSDGQGDRWPLVGGGGQAAPGNSMVNARNAHGISRQPGAWVGVTRAKLAHSLQVQVSGKVGSISVYVEGLRVAETREG